ncbi:MAG: hypothetical protein A2Z97_11935 [Bdellovibrionales bacterium GWB1_52_6]|nr:MAG: hypothetical protein A2Z97_11935 [Bdellovibrionales bacterium GWB1_52_6]OFZ05330.1 MAG: hypothetical protein A2X97_16415 [Bdellovibrionales bacterium GWA1_52_35]HCM38547.1 hypothetical protein [Bdellovibrionales bacterium]
MSLAVDAGIGRGIDDTTESETQKSSRSPAKRPARIARPIFGKFTEENTYLQLSGIESLQT